MSGSNFSLEETPKKTFLSSCFTGQSRERNKLFWNPIFFLRPIILQRSGLSIRIVLRSPIFYSSFLFLLFCQSVQSYHSKSPTKIYFVLYSAKIGKGSLRKILGLPTTTYQFIFCLLHLLCVVEMESMPNPAPHLLLLFILKGIGKYTLLNVFPFD